MSHLAEFARNNLDRLAQENRLRQLAASNRDGVYITRNNRKLISFSCNDYLGLSSHPKIKEAACHAIKKYGAGSGASRLVTGNNPLYFELESALAKIKGTESALVFGSGFMANIGIIPALVGKGDLIIADRLVHASIIDGCQLSGAKLLRFAHNDAGSCRKLLQKHRTAYKNCLVVTDHIFSMDGDIAPIDELYVIAEENDAWLMTDDAHGLGVLSPENKYKPHVQMGTLSKAIGSYGGYVCTQKPVADYLATAARSLVYSTALPPATLAASIEALKIIASDKELCQKPLQNAKIFTTLLGMAEAQSAIVPLITGSETSALNASRKLEEAGFLVMAIRPPTVPKGTARLRFAFSALHTEEDIRKLVYYIRCYGVLR